MTLYLCNKYLAFISLRIYFPRVF